MSDAAGRVVGWGLAVLATVLVLIGPATARAGTHVSSSGSAGGGTTAAVLATTVALALLARRR